MRRIIHALKVLDMRDVVSGRLIQKSVTALLAGVFAGIARMVTRGAATLAASLALTMTAMLAAWIPAQRAARVDPAVALRDQ